MIFQLDDELWFPNPRDADEDGCLAVGGDLSVDRLLLAYQHGIFPSEIHVSHSMRTLLNKGLYEITANRDFEAVISNCSRLRYEEEGAWLGEEMIKAYTELHRQGFAASIEVWEKDKLVGGLYGVNIGKAFFGESMFSLVPNGSKVALIFLARLMESSGGTLIDCQFETSHLRSMGGRYISYEKYLKLIRA